MSRDSVDCAAPKPSWRSNRVSSPWLRTGRLHTSSKILACLAFRALMAASIIIRSES